jgi:hypothetical protein
MIQLGPSRIHQVDRQELDDEEVIVRSARFAHEAIILQPDARVGFTSVIETACHPPLGNAVGAPKVTTECPVGSTCRRLRSPSAKKLFLPPEAIGWIFVPRSWDMQGSKQRPHPDIVRSSPPTTWW